MQLSARSYALTVSNTAAALNVEPPAEYLDELAHADEVAAVISGIAATTADDLHHAVIDAVSAGRDYRADENVTRLLVTSQIAASNIGQTARNRADNELRDTLAQHSDSILAGWSAALETHSDAMYAAAQAFPDMNLRDADKAIARGGAVMHHMHAVQAATKAWSAALAGHGALAAAARVSLSRHDALVYTAAPADELVYAIELARAERRDVSAWDLARAKVTLRLPTLGEYQKRVARFEADREAEARDYAARRQEAGFNTR